MLKERAPRAEELRHLPPETLDDFRKSGIHNVYTPARFGGYDMDWGTHVAVSKEIARGCGSAVWNSSVVLSHTWFLARFSPEAQEEVWSENKDAIIATAFARSEGTTEPVEGGYMISGRWRFASGVVGADWSMVSAALPPGVEQSKEGKAAGSPREPAGRHSRSRADAPVIEAFPVLPNRVRPWAGKALPPAYLATTQTTTMPTERTWGRTTTFQ